jgi:hypothetical protein
MPYTIARASGTGRRASGSKPSLLRNGSESASRISQEKKMNRFIMAMALAFAVAAAPIASQSVWAVEGHHPKTQAKKAKKKTSIKTSSAMGMTMMNCPMMQGGPMAQAGMMSCPMMAAHDPGMMPSPQRMMMPDQHSMMMQMMHGQCWFETDRDRGYGYWGQCQL